MTPDITGQFSFVSLLDNLGVVVDGLGQTLDQLQKALDQRVFSARFPLFGNKLKDGAQLIQSIRTRVLSQLHAELDDLGSKDA